MTSHRINNLTKQYFHQAEQFSFIPLSSSFLCFVCLYSSLGNNCRGKTTCSSNRKNDNVCRRNVSETSTDVVIRRNCFLLSDEVGVLRNFFKKFELGGKQNKGRKTKGYNRQNLF